RQQRRRELLWNHADGASRRATLGHTQAARHRHVRMDRGLVQPVEAALLLRNAQPRRLRASPHAGRSCGMIITTNLSAGPGEAHALSSSNGKVTIDLSQVGVEARKRLDAKGITVFDKVPAVKGVKFVLFQSNQLTRIQGVVRFLNHLAVVLPIVTLLCFAGAVALTRNR